MKGNESTMQINENYKPQHVYREGAHLRIEAGPDYSSETIFIDAVSGSLTLDGEPDIRAGGVNVETRNRPTLSAKRCAERTATRKRCSRWRSSMASCRFVALTSTTTNLAHDGANVVHERTGATPMVNFLTGLEG